MASALLIRPMRLADLDQALQIQAVNYPPDLQEGEAAFASRLALSAGYCLAAERDGRLVGYLLAHGWRKHSPPPVDALLVDEGKAETLFIHDLAVSAAAQGSGVGRALVARALGEAARDGLAVAELIAVEGAGPYWQSLGFDEAPVSDELAAKVAGYGRSARWMEKVIAPSP